MRAELERAERERERFRQQLESKGNELAEEAQTIAYQQKHVEQQINLKEAKLDAKHAADERVLVAELEIQRQANEMRLQRHARQMEENFRDQEAAQKRTVLQEEMLARGALMEMERHTLQVAAQATHRLAEQEREVELMRFELQRAERENREQIAQVEARAEMYHHNAMSIELGRHEELSQAKATATAHAHEATLQAKQNSENAEIKFVNKQKEALNV